MGQIRVLVVDDSVFAREVIIGLLSDDSEIKIIGDAAEHLRKLGMKTGQKLLKKVETLNANINGVQSHNIWV